MFFKDVVGHKALKKQLIANVTKNRISHAQLFLGPEGSGKLTLALAYARYIHCHNRGPEDACGTCPSCIKFNKLEHPDLHFYFPTAKVKDMEDDENVEKKPRSKLFYNQWRELLRESSYVRYNDWLEKLGVQNQQTVIYAEDCNDIIKDLGLKAFGGQFRIVIIWMIEKLQYQAAPKLLKTLEEPPEGTIFLLISENKDAILKTILSRAQMVKIPLIEDADIEQRLNEMHECNPEKARQIAFLAGGNFSEALRILETNNEPQADFGVFRDWMRLCFQKKVKDLLQWVDKFSRAGRERQKAMLQYGLTIFRQCLLQNYQAGQALRLEGEQRDFIEKFSPYVNHNNALEIIDAFNQAIYHVERNANPKILFTDLSFNLARLFRQAK
jgi:DNA polymerase III subunit delta'